MGINEYIQIGTRIKEARTKAGMAQKEMAEKLHISVSSYSNYENGYREPSFETIRQICKILESSVDELLGLYKIEGAINAELSRLDSITRQHIQLFESDGYKIELGDINVQITDKKKTTHIVSRKDFMTMIHHCYIDMDNNMEKLLRNYIH